MNNLYRSKKRLYVFNLALIWAGLFTLTGALSAQTNNLTGIVVNPTGESIDGAAVLGKSTSVGTFTDSSGNFSIGLPDSVQTLIVQFLGFRTREVPIQGKSNFTIVLTPSASTLDEVVVVGFGTQHQRELTTAISTLSNESIEGVSVPVFQRALQGQLPGVVITNASGGLNSESIIRIRGVGSISAGNQPLFVVDGLILAARPGGSLGYSTNPLIGLNPNDIASVEVLRDAAAAAIYGARGSNGVVLITTKKGQYNTAPKVNVDYYAGFSEISKRHDLLNGLEYARLWNESALNAGFTVADDPDLFLDEETQPNTDWQEFLLRQGFVQEASAQVKGGTKETRYFLGGSFRQEDSYLRTTGIQRYALRANLEQRLGKGWVVGLSLSPSRVIDDRSGNQWPGSAWGATGWFPPNVEALDSNGVCRRDPILGFPGNPCVVLEDQGIRGITTHILSNLSVSWNPFKSLQLRSELGVESYDLAESSRFGSTSWFGIPSGAASFDNMKVFNYNWTNTISWNPRWQNGHHLSLFAGLQWMKESYQLKGAGVVGFTDDRILELGAAASPSYVYSERSEAAFEGYFLRANYNWKDRYFVTASARYDGSTRFGTNNRYGFFPALSAGWLLSEEAGFQWEGVSHLKLRTSIGSTGNTDIGNDPYRGLVDFNADYNGESGYNIQSLENDNLGWERNTQWNIGLDFGLWKDRISGSVDYYIKDTRDLLLERPVPATNGVNVLLSNVGAVRNQGLELALSGVILPGNFSWNVSLNGATLKNEVLKLVDSDGDGLDEDLILNSRMLFRPGLSIGSFYLVKYAGVDPDNGDALFEDLDGNLVRGALPAHRQVTGNALPSFVGGITNIFRYKGLDLTIFFQFKTGHSIYWESSLEFNMSDVDNQRRSQLNAWRPDNRDTDVPQARLFQYNGTQASTRYLHRGDFLRLQHLNLGYTLPDRWMKGTSIRLFAAGQNLFTWTKFPGLDPDSEFYAPNSAALGAIRYNMPAARTFTFGCNLSFQ